MDESLFQEILDLLPDLVNAKDVHGRMLVSCLPSLTKHTLLLRQNKRTYGVIGNAWNGLDKT